MKNIIIKLIKIYQVTPFGCHSKCRFIPTCSNYMIDALNEWGLCKGLYLGIKRILRCNPFCKSGIDLVPRKKNREMKKIIMFVAIILMTTACSFNSDPYDGATVYSTVYPITYLMDKLYGDYSTTSSIYPIDSDIEEYSLTEKQITNYANDGDIFIYLGLTDEKNIAKDFVNENGNILLVDATIGLSINDSVEELWLSPNNYLMLVKNVRDNLYEALDNQIILDSVDENYEYLYEVLSLMDAELRSVGNTATLNDDNILVVTSDAFKYLENYGFTVISLEDENYQSEEAISAIESNFSKGRYLALINEYGDESDFVNSLIDDYDAETINLSTFYSSDNEVDYLEAMNDFIISLNILTNN